MRYRLSVASRWWPMINSVIMKWMGEIGAGHSVTALYEVKLYPDAHGKVKQSALGDPIRQIVEIAGLRYGQIAFDFEEADPCRAVVVAEYAGYRG